MLFLMDVTQNYVEVENTDSGNENSVRYRLIKAESDTKMIKSEKEFLSEVIEEVFNSGIMSVILSEAEKLLLEQLTQQRGTKSVLRFRVQREKQLPRRGLPLRTGRRDDTMWIPTVKNMKSVLEFVTVGKLATTSLCSVVKGGGNSHNLVKYKMCVQRANDKGS